jgi:hypothetical protein
LQALYDAFEVKHYLTPFFTIFIPASLFDWHPVSSPQATSGNRRAKGLSRLAVALKKLTRWVTERNHRPERCAEVVAATCTKGKHTQHGKLYGLVIAIINWEPARIGQTLSGWCRG